MNPFEHDEPQFLEPAHCHDPTHVSHITAIPSSVFEQLPAESQASLEAVQESTSVAFASHTRLQDLVRERFNRLVPAKDQDHNVDTIVEFSEPAFFNYINHLRAEKEYLLEEAYPDWKHKAMRIDLGGLHKVEMTINDRATTLLKWWSSLRNTVEQWMEDAEDAEIFNFDETVKEFKTYQAKEIRKNEARNERNRRRKTILDLERPDFNKLEKMDSGVGL